VNAVHLARTAYRPSHTATRAPRSVEYEAFVRVTRRIRDAAASEAPDRRARLFEALAENQRLWTGIAESVADERNELPDDLRARLFYLAEFTLQHTAKVFRREVEPDVLTDINASVMRGLKRQATPQ